MSSAPSVPVLPFAELLDELRRHGFVIGLDQHLRMQLLLDHLAGECPPERLKTHLAPIFATSREEQERFHRIFDRLYPVFAEVEREEQERHSGHTAETLVPPRTPAPPERRWWIFGLGVVLLVILLAGLWSWLAPGSESPAPVSQVTIAPNPTPLPTPGGDSLAPLDSIAAVIPPPSLDTLPPEPAELPGQGFLERHRTGLRFILIVLAVTGFLFNEWRLYQRRRLVVSRERRQKPPFTWPVRLESPTNPFAQSADLPNAARLLRQREAGDVARLSVEETVTATIAALGFPTFRYRTDTRAPDYLLLIERSAHRDHAARLYQALGRSLEREGVHVTRYLHDGDPRVCYSEDGEQRELLVDLRRRFPDYRLLLFSKGEKLVDQVTGRLHSWTTQFLSWSDRAILTPESPAAWGLREVALAQHFVVLPATTAGLVGVVGHFRGPTRPDPSRWRALDQDPAAPRLDDGDPLATLQSYLGPRVYRWLCACAVYPELHWDLTLHFGTLTILGPGLISEENLLRLLRLPWFRQGAIPDEIRARLIDELNEAEERAVREAIVELLERNPAPGDSVSANRYELDLVVQRLALHRRDPKQRRAAMRELAGFPRRELVQDFAMLKLIEETPSSRLQVLLPRRLRRVFYRDGVPVLGMKTGVRMAVLTGVIGAGLLLTQAGKRELWSDNISLNSFSGDADRMIVGEQLGLTPMRIYGSGENRLWGTWQGELLKWRVDHPEVLSVEGGIVTANAVGKARVIVSSGRDSAMHDIEVFNRPFAFDRDSLRLNPGDVRALKLVVPTLDRREISPFTIASMLWTIEDSTVMRVRAQGVIEALSSGRTRVTVKGLGQTASLIVTVGRDSGQEAETVAQATSDSGGTSQARYPDITAAINRYARAMATADLASMLALYPSMPAPMRNGYRALFARKYSLDTDEWRFIEIRVAGDTATALMRGNTYIVDTRHERGEAQPFPRDFRLVKRAGRWIIMGIDAGPTLGTRGATDSGGSVVKLLKVEPTTLELRPLQSGLVTVVAVDSDGTERLGSQAGLKVSSNNPGIAIAELRPGGVAISGRARGTTRIMLEAGAAKASVVVTVGPSPVDRDTGLARDAARRFDAAISKGDLPAMLKLYPDMPDEIRARYRGHFQSGDTTGNTGWAEGELVRRGGAVTIRSSRLSMVRGADGTARAVRLPRMLTLIPGQDSWTIVNLTGEADELGLGSLIVPMESLAVRVSLTVRAEIEATIQRLAEALSDQDLKGMESVYPAMPEEMRRGYTKLFAARWTINTGNWRVLSTSITGDSAVVSLGGTTVMVDSRQGANREMPWPREIRLRKQEGTWRIVSIDGQGDSPDPSLWIEATPDSVRPETPRNINPAAFSAYNRALLYQNQDSLQKASDSFREALRIYPDFDEALKGLTEVTVRQRLNDWTKHLEGRNLTGLLQLYPEMPEKDQQAWKRLLENPSVTRLSVTAQDVRIELTGPDNARIRYALAYSMTVRPGGLQTSVNRYEATVKLIRGAWLITSMQGLP